MVFLFQLTGISSVRALLTHFSALSPAGRRILPAQEEVGARAWAVRGARASRQARRPRSLESRLFLPSHEKPPAKEHATGGGAAGGAAGTQSWRPGCPEASAEESFSLSP